MCGIYKITNMLNGKVYIGKSTNLAKRKKAHFNACDDNMIIHQAMKKHGKNNFSFEIIEECSEKELDEREIYWIKYYNSYMGEGYNATAGGEGASHPVKISNENLLLIIEDLQHSDLSIKEIGQKYGVSSTTIGAINNGDSRIIENIEYPIRSSIFSPSKEELHEILMNTQGDIYVIADKYKVHYVTVRGWCDKYNLPKTRKNYDYIDKQSYHSTPIIQYDKDTGDIIAEFDSIREAGRILGLNHIAIHKALNSKSHYSQGYIWKRKQ